MKAKAEAEAKQMQAQGLKRGEDFVDCKCTAIPALMPVLLLLCVVVAIARWLTHLSFSLLADLDGNKQADGIKEGLGSLGGLKKEL